MKPSEKVSSHQFASMIVLYIMGASLVFGTAPQAGKDVGFAIALSIIVAMLYAKMYLAIFKLYPNMNLFEILDETMGVFLGRIITAFYIFYCLYTIGIILFDFKSLLLMVDIGETPGEVVTLFFAVIMVLGVKYGVETIGRWSTAFVILIVGFVIAVVFMEIHTMDIENILPFLSNDMKSILLGAYSAFTFPFGEIFIFAGLVDAIRDPEDLPSVFYISLLFGGIVILITSMAEILVLGEFEYSISYFPAYIALSRVNVSIVQRMEILGAPLLIITGYLKVTIYLLVACRGIKRIFNLKTYRSIVIPTTLISVIFTSLQSDSMMGHWEWGAHIWPWFAFPFLIIFPVLIFILALIKKKNNTTS